MNEANCNVIQDILPLYLDNAVSEDTAKIKPQTAEKENNCKEIEVLLEKMPRSKQLRAIADIIDLLEEKYQEE